MYGERTVSRVSRRFDLKNRCGRYVSRDAPSDVLPSTPEAAYFLLRVSTREDRAMLMYEIGDMGFVHTCIRFQSVLDYLVPRVDELRQMCSMALI